MFAVITFQPTIKIAGYLYSPNGNVANAFGKIEEALYLGGVLAGLMKSWGSLCFVYFFFNAPHY